MIKILISSGGFSWLQMATSLFSLSLESWKFNLHGPVTWKVLNGF